MLLWFAYIFRPIKNAGVEITRMNLDQSQGGLVKSQNSSLIGRICPILKTAALCKRPGNSS